MSPFMLTLEPETAGTSQDAAAARARTWAEQQEARGAADERIVSSFLDMPQGTLPPELEETLMPLWESKLRQQVTVLARERYLALNGIGIHGFNFGTISVRWADLAVLIKLLFVLFVFGHDLGKLVSSLRFYSASGDCWEPNGGLSLGQFVNARVGSTMWVVPQVGLSAKHDEYPLQKGMMQLCAVASESTDFLGEYFELCAIAQAQSAAQIRRALAPFTGVEGKVAAKAAACSAISCNGSEFVAQLVATSDRLATQQSKLECAISAIEDLVLDLRFFVVERTRLEPLSINHCYIDLYLKGNQVLLGRDSLACASLKELYASHFADNNQRSLEVTLRQSGIGEGWSWYRIVCGDDLIYQQAKLLDLRHCDFSELYAQVSAQTRATSSAAAQVTAVEPQESLWEEVVGLDPYFQVLVNALAQYALAPEPGLTEVPSFIAYQGNPVNLQVDRSKIKLLGATPPNLTALLKRSITAATVVQVANPLNSLPQRIVVFGGKRLLRSHHHKLSDFELEYIWEQLPEQLLQRYQQRLKEQKAVYRVSTSM